jgi:hypothetical protein
MAKLVFFCFLAAVCAAGPAIACTGFCASNGRMVLVGNNEDDNNPFTVMWFVPPGKGTFGRLYVGYDDFQPQGGMNERGLWFDAFATAPVEATSSAGKPVYAERGSLMGKALAECATVEQVLRLYSQYNLSFMKGAVLMFADASGDSAVIEPNAVLRKQGAYQVQTNFHQSRPEYRCERFEIARAMLGQAGDRISIDLFRGILAATHEEDTYPTVYSNIYDLKRRVMYLYHFHNFENVVKIDLREELKKGVHSVAMRDLFPKSFAALAYTEVRAKEMKRTEPPVASADPAMYDAYVGDYRLENGVVFSILRRGDRLMLDAEPIGTAELYPESPSKFFLRITNFQVNFLRGGDGKVQEVLGRMNGRDLTGKRTK